MNLLFKSRNIILSNYENTLNQDGAFVQPVATKFKSELDVLNDLITKANKWKYADWTDDVPNTYGSTLYYPAASACFAYEPVGVSKLADKFKKRNWFLPASGDMIRILYYVYQSFNNGNVQDEPFNSKYDSSYNEPANAFANAIKLNVLNINRMSGYFLTSTEQNRDSNFTINTYSQCNYWTKYSTAHVLPICKF